MSDDVIVAVHAHVVQVRDFKGLGVTRITLEIPIEHFVNATAMLYEQDVIVTRAPPGMKGSPYGLRRGDEPPPQDERESTKGGPLSELAGMWCRSSEFQKWMRKAHKSTWAESSAKDPEQIARDVILRCCEIKSRRELDHDAKAARVFNDAFRAPFAEHLHTTKDADAVR
jgi:hypothetical protein